MIEPLETRIAMDASGILFDEDGDRVEIRLSGPGLFAVTQNDPDNDLFGSVAKLDVRGTTIKSQLSISVKKSATGNGNIDIGELLVNADIGAINAQSTNLIDLGLNAGGFVGKLTLRDVKNGADIITAGRSTEVSRVRLGLLGEGCDLTFGSAVQGSVGSAVGGTWSAPRFGVLTVAGEFGADIISTALAIELGKIPSLASLSITGGNLTGQISANGEVGAVSVKSAKHFGGAILGTTISASGLKGLSASGNLNAIIAVSGSVENITSGGDAGGAWTAASFGAIKVANGNLSATINSLSLANSLGKRAAIAGITVTGGNISGNIFAFGNVGNINVASNETAGGSLIGSTLAASGFGNLNFGKNLTDALILAGVNLGDDHALGGAAANADTFSPGSIGRINIGGVVTNSVIGAGLFPVDGVFKNGDDKLLGSAKTALIKSFDVKGSLSNDSFVGAFILPPKVKIGSETIRPVVDSRFLSNSSIGSGFLSFKLVNDTGLYLNDSVSQDVAIVGHLALTGVATEFRAAIGNGPLKVISVTPNVLGDFTLSASVLETLNGAAITDGTYTLRVETREKSGASRDAFFTFRLDTTAPTGAAIGLSLASDTDAVGDAATSAKVVTLVGNAEVGARITLTRTGQTALADNTGKFIFPNVTLADGANALTFGITDLAGNTATLNATFTKTAVIGGSDVVLEWNTENLSAITRDASAPPVASRGLAMTSIAMFDVVSAFDGSGGYYTKVAAPADASLEAAIAAAAHRVLVYLYPAQKTAFDTALGTSLARVTDGAAETAGVAFGQSIADLVIAIRSGDGFDKFVNYTPANLPGEWQPTGPGFDVALLPQWATLTPFAMQTASQFRPDGPPAIDSAAYATAFNEVKTLGAASGSLRTADQTQIARFWADGAGTITPPGHWNQIATLAATAEGNSTASNARLLAELNVALADASIAAWDAKYTYEFWRPITAIQNADTDGNDATAQDAAWQSLLITPPFPEYVSGHSTYSGAGASVLTSFFGVDYDFTIASPGLPGVTRSFASFDAAAQEAGQSRIYGGIHFQFANQDGLATGDKIGDFVHARFNTGGDTHAPVVLVDGLENGDVFATSPSITGKILDNLSGVASATAKFDKSAPIPLTLDATGKFTMPAAALSHGPHTLVINATDAVGNESSPFTVRFTVDALDPTISLNSLANGATLTVDSRLIGQADGTGSPVVSLCYQFDGGVLIPILYNTATGAFDIQPDLSELAPGAHVLTLDSIDAAGNNVVKTVNVTLDARIPFAVTEHTPASFASEIGSTFRPQVFFSRSVDPSSLTSSNFYATDTTGAVIPSTIVPAQDGSFAWLFFTNPMPSASTITVHVEGDTILAAADQQPLDGDENGTPGGTLTYSFSTVSLTPLTGTSLSGKVVDPGTDLKPMTFDDFRAGPDGIPHTADDVFLNPITGAKVFVVGLESTVFAFTDAQGNFILPSVPGGNVKLAIEGRTATNAPAGFYFPEMVMDLNIVPGTANTVMDSMGESDDKLANNGRAEVYLPRLQTSILQNVNATGNTMIGVDAKSAQNLTDTERQLLKLTVQPNILLGEDGRPLANPRIGISTVPAQLVSDMLPAGVLQHTFDITIQAPDVTAFALPLQLTFPNVFKAPPGTKLNLLSFDHATGRLVIDGTATVSPDGQSVITDSGTGITKPGWHGLTPPGSEGGGCEPEVLTWERMVDVAQMVATCVSGVVGGLSGPISLLVDLANRVPDLIQSLQDVKRKAANGAPVSQVCEDIQTIKPLVDFFVSGMSSAVQASFAPLKGADAALRCAAAILGNLSKLCADVQKDEDCKSIYIDYTCIGIEAAKQAVSVVSAWRGKLEGLIAGVSSAGVDLLFRELMRAYCPPLLAAATIELEAQVATDENPNLASFEHLAAEFLHIQTALSSANDLGKAIPDMDLKVANTLADTALLKESLIKYGGSYYLIEGDDFSLRGTTLENEGLRAFLPASKELHITLFDPMSNRVAQETIVSAPSGQRTVFPLFAFMPTDGMPDSDADMLVDLAEKVIGTSKNKSDTDWDGIPDFAELRQGLNPLDGRPAITGVIGAIALTGEAKALSSSGDLLFSATGSSGLAILTAPSGGIPVVLSQIDLPGDATDVAADKSLNRAVIASNAGGFHIVDISNPRLPTLLQSISIHATQIEIADGLAYVSDGTALRSYELVSGEPLQALALGAANITGMTIEGDTLYTMDANRVLRAVDISGPSMIAKGSITTPVGGGQIFVGNNIAYVAGEGSFEGGFAAVNVTNPNTFTLISGVDATNIAGRSLALNGSGMAVAVGSPAFFGNVIDVINAADPANTGAFVTRFTLPADPQGVTIANGLAYIADGTGGLVVVNYLSADTAGVAPTAMLSSSAVDADLIAPGVQVQAGSLLPIQLTVADDAQVASVELLKDGVLIGSDTSFPFEFGAISAGLTVGGQTTLQIRATDTGGNIGLSNTLTFDLQPDTTAPTISGSNPVEGGFRTRDSQTLRFFFSESLDPASFAAANFTLTGPGGTIALNTVQSYFDGKEVRISHPQLVPGAYTLSIAGANVKDLSGNALGTGPFERHFSIVDATSVFINPAGGAWNTAANWQDSRIPGVNDIVSLPLNSGAKVTISTGEIKVRGILTDDTLEVTGGSLTITGTADITGTLIVSNGADLIVDGTSASLTVQDPVLSGADLFAKRGGDFHFPTLSAFTSATLTLDGPGQEFDVPFLANIDNSRLFLSGGAQLTVAATSYRADGLGGTNIFTVDGPGTVLNLSTIQTWNDAWYVSYNTQAHGVRANNGGVLNLSGLQSITTAEESDDRLEFIQTTGGQINLSSLSSINGVGYVRLETASTVSLPALVNADRMSLFAKTGGVINMPNVVRFEDGDIGFEANGTVNAPQMTQFVRSVLTLDANETLNAQQFTNIDNSRLFLSGGAQLTVAATSYRADGLGGTNIFTVDGPGTVLNLSTIQTWNDAWYVSYNTQAHGVRANNGGVLNLSGLQSITTAEESDDRLEFIQTTGGQINLSSLSSINGVGYVRLETASTVSLPALVNADRMSLFAKTGGVINMPNVVRFEDGDIGFEANGTVNAPQMTQFVRSVLTLDANETLNAQQFTNIDNSRLFLSGGAQLTVAATSYRADGLGGTNIFTVDGPGTVLNLSTIQTWNDAWYVSYNTQAHGVRANNGGVLNLSGLQSITTAEESDDRLEFIQTTGGQINLSSLSSINGVGYVRLETASTVSLPALVNADRMSLFAKTGGVINMPNVVRFEDGDIGFEANGTVNAPQMTQFVRSVLTLDANETLNAQQFTNIDNSRLFLSGGAQLTVAATSYRADGLGGTNIFTVDGPGTVLNLSTIQTWNDAWYVSYNTQAHGVRANNGGVLNLSGLQSITTAEESDDRLEFIQTTGGQINLSSLSSINGVGYVRLETASTVSLPALVNADRMSLFAKTGGVINMPNVVRFEDGDIGFEANGTVNAPQMTQFVRSVLTLDANETLNAQQFTNIDNSRLFLSGGAQLTVAATSYRADGLGGTNIFTVDGPGTVLNLSTIQTWNDAWYVSYNTQAHGVRANNGGVLNLSGLQSITTAEESDDRLEFIQTTGGQINLSSLSSINGVGYAQFEVTDGTMTVGSLASGKANLAIGLGGHLHVLGDLTIQSGRDVWVDVAGTGVSQHGRIQVDGAASLAGTFNIVRPTGFVPNIGDSFQLLTYGTRSGTFGSITGTTAAARTFNATYNPLNFALNVT